MRGRAVKDRPSKDRPNMSARPFWAKMASLVSGASVVIDRPKGSAHPRYPELIYPLDYGYLTGTHSGDGKGIDVWIGSLRNHAITGVVCTIDLEKRDTEIKILLGCSRAEQHRMLSFHNGGNAGAILVRARRYGALTTRKVRIVRASVR
jgi:inorganic pyrophosphatase